MRTPYSSLNSHGKAARLTSDSLLESVIGDLEKQNLSNLRDHETRWKAERIKEFRAERKLRKTQAKTQL